MGLLKRKRMKNSNNRTVIIYRSKNRNEKQSVGFCVVIDDSGNVLFSSQSLERGWLNNKKRVSCVPAGVYDLVLEYSPRFGKDLWELKNVPGRSECKFHSINFSRDLNGCIGLGSKLFDLDYDGLLDVTNSRNTMKRFHKAMGPIKKSKVVIIDS